MIQKVLLPKLGQTVETAVIETWHKAEGDKIAKGDILCEITTDKATLEVESYAKGTLLKILGQAGQEMPVNSIIAIVGDTGEEIPAELLAGGVVDDDSSDAPAPAAPAPQAAPAPAVSQAAPAPAAPALKPAPAPAAPPPPPAAPDRVFVSPRARKLAKAEHVPVVVLQGTGPNGRIVEADVGAYVLKVKVAKVSPLARKLAVERNIDVLALASAGGKVTKDDVLAAQPVVAVAAASMAAPKGGRVPLTPMRRIVAERMLQSKHEIPCYYLHMDVDFTDLMSARRKLNDKFGAQGGPKVSINDYIIMACARALSEFPEANSRWDGDGIIQRGDINVSMAVALDQGLIVPVIKNCERRSLADVAIESRSLVEKARSKRLLPEEYEGGTMTVSNLGMFGIKHFIPVVNPGESCILGLGIIEERVVVRQGGIHIRQMMTMAMACDHRLIDGAVGARFLERIRDLLEDPAGLAK
jgi:pyruvate dehydrogenase E2 component (dihydrolipoyllysine-residue acetyltransferase)